jgi:hypothetical protein
MNQSSKLTKATSIKEYLPGEIVEPGIYKQGEYLLAMPPDVEVITNDKHIRAQVNFVMENEDRIYDLVTSIEDYPFTMQEFIDSKIGKLSTKYTVLIIYYDSELGYYCTMTVEVILIDVNGTDDSSSEGSSGETEERFTSPYIVIDLSNQVILKFNDWNKKNFDTDSY